MMRAAPQLAVVDQVADPAALLAALPVACVQIDAGDRFRFANPAAEQFFGHSLGQLRKLGLHDLLRDESPVLAIAAHVRASGTTVSERDLTLDGPRLARRGVAVTCAPLPEPPGPEPPGALLMTFYDWSAALALDRQVKLRSAARSVAGMAAMLAHEVKNPLSGIRGAAQLLERAAGDGDRELAVLIREETDRISALLDRMEAFGDAPVARTAVNIHRVLDHVRRLAGTGFAAHLRIGQDYDPSLPPVLGNRDQLVQVVLNLVKNAAEAITESGTGGEIVLSTAYQPGVRLTGPAPGLRLPLLVTVRDDGPGIADEVERTLFEPFVSTRSGGSGLGLAACGLGLAGFGPGPAGSGLGLALVAKIVGDHGGIVEVESRPGRTEFRLFLPVFPETA